MIPLTGTIANAGAILAGCCIGITAGKKLPERIKTIIMQALGLSVIVIGLKMALSGSDAIMSVGCLILGGITGELLKIEKGVESCGAWVKKKVRSRSSTFVEGFVTASVLYLTGAMMIVGSIQDGSAGDPSTLYVKSVLDGFASIALSSTLGLGVAFSALSVFLVQGGITLLSSELAFLQDPLVLNAIISTGGFLIMAIGTNLLGITRIRVGNLIPALVYAVIWVVVTG